MESMTTTGTTCAPNSICTTTPTASYFICAAKPDAEQARLDEQHWQTQTLFEHQKDMANTLATPVTAAYCVTMVVIAAFILILAAIRSSERINTENNQAEVEIARMKGTVENGE